MGKPQAPGIGSHGEPPTQAYGAVSALGESAEGGFRSGPLALHELRKGGAARGPSPDPAKGRPRAESLRSARARGTLPLVPLQDDGEPEPKTTSRPSSGRVARPSWRTDLKRRKRHEQNAKNPS